MRKLLNDRGVALITAMLISALAAMVAANLAWDNALDVRRTIVLLNRDQAVQVALGAESWIINILHQDLEESQSDHLAELWASDLPPLPIDNGEVFGAIEDLQGRFNVNNLIDSDGQIDQESLDILDANHAAVRLYGYSKEELLGAYLQIDHNS